MSYNEINSAIPPTVLRNRRKDRIENEKSPSYKPNGANWPTDRNEFGREVRVPITLYAAREWTEYRLPSGKVEIEWREPIRKMVEDVDV